MIGPIQGPGSPQDWDDGKEPKGQDAKLFRKVSNLYFFLMAKDIVAHSDRASYTTLAKIMQICKHGGCIDEATGSSAAKQVDELKEFLQSGKIQKNAVSTKLQDILSLLTDDSRKARLIKTLTELEMTYFHNDSRATEEQQKKYGTLVHAIIERITQDTPDINAEAINRDLTHFLNGDHPIEEILQELEFCHKRWLS